MCSFNGIQFNQYMNEVGTYQKDIVPSICNVVPPDIKWDDSHVQGRSRLCETICEKIKEIQPSEKYKACVIGFYGIGGLGKTTMCKILCNEFSEEFEGKVCHVELAFGRSSEELLKEVLKESTSTSQELQKLNDGELERLKNKGLLEDVNFNTGKFSIHDLYHEFAVMESQGKLNPINFKSRRWVYERTYPPDLKRMPSDRCWETFIQVGFDQSKMPDDGHAIQSLKGIKWKYFSNVVVLKLVGLEKMLGVLNLKGLKCLRSLELTDFHQLDKLEGLEDLNNLTYFRWLYSYNGGDFVTVRSFTIHLEQLLVSLKVLQVNKVPIYLIGDVIACCTNLCQLELCGIGINHGLDFSNLTSLRDVKLSWIKGLRSLWRLSTELTFCLQSLRINICKDMTDVSDLENLLTLKQLYLQGPNAKLNKFLISRLPALQHLNLCGCKSLTILEGIGDLPALQHLKLDECKSLPLPNLSKSLNLEELNLARSGIELHEEDICMLARLRMLQPVEVAIYSCYPSIKLKLVRHIKVLTYWDNDNPHSSLRCIESPYRGWTWENEEDLGIPPIKVIEFQP